jgi:serine/threonine protein kinase
VDSVTPIAALASGKVKCVSYSKGWAAPEQMHGRIDKLCPATDIYSIGAILFQKVMGRAIENEDIGIFADWDFDGEMFDDVNPAIKRLLREIFKKTLAANAKRRYQTANELIDALDETLKVAEQEVYLVNEDVISEVEFVGRSSDIANMHNLFANGTKAIFLHGFGGVGKTALARRFAELYASEYDCVQFHRYTKDLSTIIDDYMIQHIIEHESMTIGGALL